MGDTRDRQSPGDEDRHEQYSIQLGSLSPHVSLKDVEDLHNSDSESDLQSRPLTLKSQPQAGWRPRTRKETIDTMWSISMSDDLREILELDGRSEFSISIPAQKFEMGSSLYTEYYEVTSELLRLNMDVATNRSIASRNNSPTRHGFRRRKPFISSTDSNVLSNRTLGNQDIKAPETALIEKRQKQELALVGAQFLTSRSNYDHIVHLPGPLVGYQSTFDSSRHAENLASFTFEPTENPETPSCRLCRILTYFWFLIVAVSLAVGFWRSTVTGDEGKGFTDAAYVVAVGGLVLFPVQNRHAKRCREANG